MNDTPLTACPVCGAPGRVTGTDEGTQHFEPLTDAGIEEIRTHANGPGHHYSLDDCRLALDAASKPGLDEAWAAAEAALPDGWHMGEVKNTSYRGVNASGQSERWLAMAWAERDERTFNSSYGDSPVEALRGLAAALAGTT